MLGLTFIAYIIVASFATPLVSVAIVLIMISATGFWSLFIGALVISLGNGLIEAVCNPLVVTLYPERKAHRLNQFHMWWPGGIVLGGLASYGLAQIGITSWKVRLGLILIPAVVYIFLMLKEEFPAIAASAHRSAPFSWCQQ